MNDSTQTTAVNTPGAGQPGNAAPGRKGWWRMSLRAKGALVIIVLLVVSFVIATYASIASARSALTNTLKNNLVEQSKLEAGEIRSFLIWTKSFAVDLAAATETNNFSGRVISDTVENFLRRNEQIYGSTIAYEPYQFRRDLYYWSPYYSRTDTGNIRFTQLGNPEYNYFKWDWYTLPKLRNEPVLSPPYFDEGGGEIWMVTWSVPFYNSDGEFRGVATADIAFSQTQELVRDIAVGKEGYAFLIDPNGVVLGIGDKSGQQYSVMEDTMLLPSNIEQSAQWNALIQRMMTGTESGFEEVTDPQGNPVFVAYEPIGLNTGWTLGLAYSQKELFEPVNRLQNTMVIIAAIVVLVFSLASVPVIGLITRPLQSLAVHVKEFSQARAASSKAVVLKPIQIRSGDEMEDLGAAFNQMTLELTSALATLESKVAERTAELESANALSKKRAQQFEAIARVSRDIASTQKLEELLPRICQAISEQFGYYHVGIFLNDDENQYSVLRAANSQGGQNMLARGHHLKIGEQGIVGYVTGTGNPRIALNVGEEAIYFNNPDLPDTRSEMAIPLKIGLKTIGALDVQSVEPGAFKADDIASLSLLADQVSIAIENARLYEATLQSLEQSQLQYRRYVRDEWSRLVQEEGLAGYRFAEGSGTPLEEAIPLGEAARSVQEGRIFQREGTQASDTAELAVPVRLRGEVIGVLNISAPGKRRWSDDDIDIAEAVSERLALAMENARLFQATNRRAERERIVSEIASKIGGSIRIESLLETTAQELSHALNGSEVLIQLQAVKQNGGPA